LRYLIGVDDTDNHESRGTGFRARGLGAALAEAGIARPAGVSRHQLFVHPDIPYTSHNSSLCLDVVVESGRLDELPDFCRDFVARESADGSDAGLCIAPWDTVGDAVTDFGRRAKSEVLDQSGARGLATRHELLLEGLTGDEGGVIGALAAVGLRRGGADGRFVWLEGVRELSGVHTAEGLLAGTGIDVIRVDGDGVEVSGPARIDVGKWPRAVLLEDRAILLVQAAEKNDDGYDWQTVPREIIRRY
jgi:hypothetical protein